MAGKWPKQCEYTDPTTGERCRYSATSGMYLGMHYREFPTHKPAQAPKTPRDPLHPGRGRKAGGQNLATKQRKLADHLLDVFALYSKKGNIAEGIKAWADQSPENMRMFVALVLPVLAERLIPREMSPDEKEIKLAELSRPTEGQGGQNINFILPPGALVPNVTHDPLAKVIEATILPADAASSDAERPGEEWDDFAGTDGEVAEATEAENDEEKSSEND